jgi:hypothetical protein
MLCTICHTNKETSGPKIMGILETKRIINAFKFIVSLTSYGGGFGMGDGFFSGGGGFFMKLSEER